jgi:Flp pilus assembly protein TadD
MAEACVQYEEALRLVPGDPETQNNLALLLATSEEPSLRNGEMAVRLAREANDRIGGRNPLFLRTLAAALAETGRFSDAAQTARSGIELAQATGQPGLVARLSDELKLYEAARPLRH